MEVKNKIYQSKALDLDKKGQVLIAVNAFGNTDSDGDISQKGSFTKTLKENFNRVRWFLNHDVTILLGVPIKGFEEGDFLKMHAQFNMEKQISRDTYEDYKLYAEHGKSLEHSVGLQAIKNFKNTDGTRTVTEWKLWEFSTLTHWGANDNTPLLGIKSTLEAMERNPNYSDHRKKEINNIYESLFIEPSRVTHAEKADLLTVFQLLNL